MTVQPFSPVVVPQGWAACTAPDGRFAVAYPASWEQGQCGSFDPDMPRRSESSVLNVVALSSTLADTETALQNPTWQPVTSRTETTINGRRALRLERECVPACGVAERDTTWLLDGGTFTVSLNMRWDPSMGSPGYDGRQRILEQAVRSVRM